MRKLILLAALALAALTAVSVASAKAGATALTGTVGPEDTITLTKAGHAVRSLAAGTYTIRVKDLATDHDFHLTGPGVNKTTTVGGTGAVTWHVTLRKGTYRFVCDPHASFMKGSFTVA